ncbi:TIGR02710 family CRISPR-associated CARF protein [Acidimicrobiales bacterium]|nr:TIGR02710 family CRISPR-associated CARF protein [Acidimicrobiales bacterium]
MRRVLFITVGGSADPIIEAVRSLSPHRIVFFCTTEPQSSVPIVEQEDGVVDSSGFEGEYEIVPVPSDQLAEIVAVMTNAMGRFGGGLELVADYTGGTKSMSAALVIASSLHGAVQLYLTTGYRTDLVKVTQFASTRPVPTGDIVAFQVLQTVMPNLLSRHAYNEGAELLQELLTSKELSRSVLDVIEPLQLACRAFDAWDSFDHEAAKRMLETLFRHLGEYAGPLDLLVRGRNVLDDAGSRDPRYELVSDLLQNADRRALVGRFDDAVARMYRSLELMAQLHLLQAHGLKTSKLPDSEGNDRPGGLVVAWDHLARLDDELGYRWNARREQLRDVLNQRNASVLAHGRTPVGADGWRAVDHEIGGFLRDLLKLVEAKSVPQLPGDRLLSIWSLSDWGSTVK